MEFVFFRSIAPSQFPAGYSAQRGRRASPSQSIAPGPANVKTEETCERLCYQ